MFVALSDCNGADCAFACSGGCGIVCLATAGTGLAAAALGGIFGGSGTAIALDSKDDIAKA